MKLQLKDYSLEQIQIILGKPFSERDITGDPYSPSEKNLYPIIEFDEDGNEQGMYYIQITLENNKLFVNGNENEIEELMYILANASRYLKWLKEL